MNQVEHRVPQKKKNIKREHTETIPAIPVRPLPDAEEKLAAWRKTQAVIGQRHLDKPIAEVWGRTAAVTMLPTDEMDNLGDREAVGPSPVQRIVAIFATDEHHPGWRDTCDRDDMMEDKSKT